jgi:hypothetical protein
VNALFYSPDWLFTPVLYQYNVPVLDEHRTRRGNEPQGTLSDVLALCVDQLKEIHDQCARAYPTFELPFSEFREAVACAALKYLAPVNREQALSQNELEHFIRELQAADL